MAITAETLAQLAAAPYGPVSAARDGDALVAVFEGRRAAVRLEGATVRLTASEAVRWPSGEAPPQDVDRRVATALMAVAMPRPDLLTLSGDRASSSVRADLWVDAERGSLYDLAVAVRTVVQAVLLGADTVAQVALNLASESELLAAARELTTAIDETRAVVEGVPMPAAAAPVPAAPSAPAAAPPQPLAPVCSNCGAALAPGARFCLACGTAVPAQAAAAPAPAAAPGPELCRNCRSPLPANVRFCPVCGTPRA